MPLEKQSLNNFLPDGFETLNQEGYKTNFSEDKIKTGYEKDIKDRVSGPNLNNLIDVVGKNTNTLNNYVEYLNGMPINNVPITDENGQLNYINLDDKLTKKQITNCILEIPQRIKYTLVDGTLTIKAGSVVIVPYGVEDLTAQYPVGATFINDNYKVVDTQFADGKFFVWAEVQSDIVSYTSGSTTEEVQFMCVSLTLNTTGWQKNTESGTSATTSQTYTLYYNTDTNLIGITKNTTTPNYNEVFSFVFLSAINSTSNSWKNINQVFNGMGYIGSTVWVDKGVKGLIPNGRNEDGSLNNIEYTTSKLANVTMGSTYVHSGWQIFVTQDNILAVDQLNYNENENYIYNSRNKKVDSLILGTQNCSNGQITSFNPKQPFRAIDYSDKSEVSGWGMPSVKHSTLTFGSNTTEYIAPANGWFNFGGSATSGDSYMELNIQNGISMGSYISIANQYHTLYVPVRKGQKMRLYYRNCKSRFAKFLYAEGEV